MVSKYKKKYREAHTELVWFMTVLVHTVGIVQIICRLSKRLPNQDAHSNAGVPNFPELG
jgi:hypothetical protein